MEWTQDEHGKVTFQVHGLPPGAYPDVRIFVQAGFFTEHAENSPLKGQVSHITYYADEEENFNQAGGSIFISFVVKDQYVTSPQNISFFIATLTSDFSRTWEKLARPLAKVISDKIRVALKEQEVRIFKLLSADKYAVTNTKKR